MARWKHDRLTVSSNNRNISNNKGAKLLEGLWRGLEHPNLIKRTNTMDVTHPTYETFNFCNRQTEDSWSFVKDLLLLKVQVSILTGVHITNNLHHPNLKSAWAYICNLNIPNCIRNSQHICSYVILPNNCHGGPRKQGNLGSTSFEHRRLPKRNKSYPCRQREK